MKSTTRPTAKGTTTAVRTTSPGNCGVEGPTDDVEINLLRERQIRNLLATLMLSQGTPMLLAGDEFGRTQGGNNNAYCQDSEISWVDWAIEDKGKSLIRFVQKLTWLRHEYPMLHYTRFLNGELKENIDTKDVTWIKSDGTEFADETWADGDLKQIGMLLDIRGYATETSTDKLVSPLLLMFNAHHENQDFVLPEHVGGTNGLCCSIRSARSRRTAGDADRQRLSARIALLEPFRAEAPHLDHRARPPGRSGGANIGRSRGRTVRHLSRTATSVGRDARRGASMRPAPPIDSSSTNTSPSTMPRHSRPTWRASASAISTPRRS